MIAELGTSCKRVKLDISAGDTRKPDFLKVNPNGRVPAIVHEGTPVWESSAITMYLGEVFGVDAKLYPAPVSLDRTRGSHQEVKQLMQEALEFHFEALQVESLPIPESTSQVEYVEVKIPQLS